MRPTWLWYNQSPTLTTIFNSGFRLLKQFGQVLLPDFRERMCAVPARPVACGYQHESPALDSLDLSLHHAKLRRVDLIVRRIDRHKPGADAFESRRGVVIARGVELVNHVISVGVGKTRSHLIFKQFVGCVAGRRLLL